MEEIMKKWMIILMTSCSLFLQAGDYNETRLIDDLGRLFKLETTEYQGNKMVFIAPNETGNPEYTDLLKKFEQYLSMISQLAETYKTCAALKDLAPDAAEKMFADQLRSNPLLRKELIPLMGRYLLGKGHVVQLTMTPKPSYDMKTLLPIAASFFYPQEMSGKLHIHICVGINGLNELKPKAPVALAAFCFQAIFRGLMARQPEITGFIDQIKVKRKEKENMDIKDFQKEIWGWLENEPQLKKLLIEEYGRAKDILPFVLQVEENSK
jgi:hypothetical protein